MELSANPEKQSDDLMVQTIGLISEKTLPNEGIDENSNSSNKIDISNELPIPSKEILEKHKDIFLQTPYSPEGLEARSNKLMQLSRTAIEETGSNLLYLVIGFLEWYEDDNSSVLRRPPLILVPITIERAKIDRGSNCYTYKVSYNCEDIETNLSLREKLKHDFNLMLPEFNSDKEPEDYFNELNKITAKKPTWRFAREMVLDLFSFSKIHMYKDLEQERWGEKNGLISQPNLINVLHGKIESIDSGSLSFEEETDIDKDEKSDSTFLPFGANWS